MKTSMDDILRRIEKGESLESIGESFIQPGESELLKLCSAVRYFDEQMVDEVFRSQVQRIGKTDVSFDQLIGNDCVELVPRTSDKYWLKDDYRERYFSSWWEPSSQGSVASRSEIPPALRQLSENLTSYFRKMSPSSDMDILYQMIISDPERASELFKTMYEKADRQFDLNRCFDLLKILEERILISNKDLAKLWKNYRIYYRARSLWAEEYYQTHHYCELESLKKQFEELLENSERWILHLYATGGMGKTMFLRWAISRWCVPEPKRIACARIDFDYVDPVVAHQEPWRLYLIIAEQLNRQIPEAPFSELLNELGEYVHMSLRRQMHEPMKSRGNIPFPEERLKNEIPDRFISALQEAGPQNPVLIVFDTLEEITLYQQSDIVPLVELVSEIREKYSNIRLILSGRYDVRQKSQEFSNRFEAQTEFFEVPGFTEDEARKYLTLIRGLSDEMPLTDIIRKARNNPFKLALFADILQDGSNLTAEEIRAYSGIDLVYLVERVVERIKNEQVRWLLRYGVIPRRLSRNFVNEVMAKYLPKSMSGNADYDDPDAGLKAELQKKRLFRTDLLASSDESVDLEHLWKTLLGYASQYSWVSQAGDAPDALIFHEDVINPMRRLIQEQKIVGLIHRDAISHFEKLADDNPENRTEWIREAIYHKFQLEGSKAGVYWRNQIKKARESRDPSMRMQLAMEVVQSEYVDEEGHPMSRADGTSMIDLETMSRAHFEIASACLEIAESDDAENRERLWQDARKHTKRLENLSNEIDIPAILRERLVWLRANLMIHDKQWLSAIGILKDALEKNTDPSSRIFLEVTLADALAAENHPDAVREFETALNLARKNKEHASVLRNLHFKLACLHDKREDFDMADTEYRRAMSLLKESELSEECKILTRMANSHLNAGRLNSAFEIVSGKLNETVRSRTVGDRLKNDFARVRFEILMSKNHFFIDYYPELVNTPETKAMEIEFKGRADSKLANYERAIEELERAEHLWEKIGDLETRSNCTLQRVKTWLDVGNLREAQRTLDHLMRITNTTSVKKGLQCFLFQAELWYRKGDYDRSLTEIDRLLESREFERLPRLLALIALKGLEYCHNAPNSSANSSRKDRYKENVVRTLGTIEPETVWVHLHDALRKCPKIKNIPSQHLSAIDRFFQKQPPYSIENMIWVEFSRIFGGADRCRNARQFLHEIIINDYDQNLISYSPSTCGKWYMFREIGLALDRLQWKDDSIVTKYGSIFKEKFRPYFSNYPHFIHEAYLEHAERLLRLSSTRKIERAALFTAFKDLLTPLAKFIEDYGRFPYGWHARVLELVARTERYFNNLNAYRNALDRAAAIYSALGDEHAVGRIADEADREAVKPIAKHKRIGRTCVVKMEVDNSQKSIRVQYDEVSGKKYGKTIGEKEVPYFKTFFSSTVDENILYRFSKLFQKEWYGIGLELGKIIWHRDMRNWREDDPVNLCLDIEDRRLGAIPWELVRIPEKTEDFFVNSKFIRYIHRVCLYWSKQGMKAYSVSETSDRSPTVLILEPSMASEQLAERGDKISGIDIEWLYQEAGFDCETISDPDIDSLVKMLESLKPDVIHMNATMKESVTGGVQLDFSPATQYKTKGKSDAEEYGWNKLDASSFNRIARLYSGEKKIPILVLNISRTPGVSEMFRQLFLRNAFATEIIDLEWASAILAVGLGGYALQEELLTMMIEGLSNKEPVGMIMKKIQKAGVNADRDSEKFLSFSTSALFTRWPETALGDRLT